MGQLCSRSEGIQAAMADTPFDANRTIKVSGISVYLRDVFTKYFQNDNKTGPGRDVDRVHVCLDGKDCVLVEFSKDQDKKVPDRIDVEINDTSLTVEPSAVTSDKDESVSQIWCMVDCPVKIGNAYTSSSTAVEKDVGNEKDEKANRNRRKALSKQQRDIKIQERRQTGHQKDNPETAVDTDDSMTEYSMFEHTKVKLNPDFLQKIQDGESQENKVLQKGDVELNSSTGYLTGPWMAVLKVFKRLYSLLDYRAEDASTSRQAVETLSISPELNGNGHFTNCKKNIISVEAVLFRYIIMFHVEVYEELESVSKEIKFGITSPNERTLEIFARGDVDDKLFCEKYDNFINFYQKLYPEMHEKVITPADSAESESPSIADIVSKMRTKFSVIVTFCQESNKITVYGEKKVVLEACSSITDRGRSITGKGHVTPKESENIGTENRNGQLMHNLSKNIKLFVYQGDITEEKADAIVNPANEELRHHGGAAKAISDRGGKTIQDESDDIMRKRRRKTLQPGDVEITTAGKLPCKFVVHAVGPQWYQHSADGCRKLLQKAVVNSLMTASGNEARIIAIPAISSGVYGVPVKLCAEVLFDTVEEFAKSATDSEFLQEIRFVNIDKMTTQVFEKEMRKRYGDAVSGGKETMNQNGLGPVNKGEKSTAIVHYHNDTSRENVPFGQGRGQGRGRGAQQNNNGGNERKGNTPRPGDQPIPNASASAKENSSIKHPPGTYSEVAKRGLTNSNDNTVTDDTSKCPICLDAMTNPKKLSKCGHSFCTACIDNAFKHQTKCPICSEVYGVLTGNQPPGQMKSHSSYTHFLPGFQGYGIIVINYNFPDGTQGQNHPHPGRPFTGTRREAYLPDNKEGQKVLRLLNKAFIQKLTFTIGRSSTTGVGDTVTWNDIHHKTNWSGGPTNFGYPDASYLKRVQEELAAKGIKE